MYLLRLSRVSLKVFYPRLYSQTLAPCGEASDKLRTIMEEYRSANYRQTIPSRFVKEVLAGVDKNKDGFLEKSEFQTFLNNIGAGDKLTSAELDEIIAEMVGGGDPGKVNGISVERAKEVMLEEIKER